MAIDIDGPPAAFATDDKTHQFQYHFLILISLNLSPGVPALFYLYIGRR